MIQELRIDQLHPWEGNPRKDVGDVTDLAASIKAAGVLQALIAMPNADGFAVIAGSRRLAGARLAGVSVVPVDVRELDARAALEIAVIDNLQREDISPIEEGEAFQGLVDAGYSQAEIAERVGVHQGTVSKRIALLKLTPKARKAVADDRLHVHDALELVKLADHPKLIDKVLSGPLHNVAWSVKRELEAVVAAERKNKALEDLRAKGTRVAKGGPPTEYGWYSIKGLKPLSGRDALKLTATTAKHGKEPCHAVHIYDDGKTVAVCTDPGRHAAKGASAIKVAKPEKETAPNAPLSQTLGAGKAPKPKQTPEEKAELERKQALIAIEAGRRDFIAKLIADLRGRKVKDAQVLAYIAGVIVRDGIEPYGDVESVACQLLGLEVTHKTKWDNDAEALLAGFASKGAAAEVRTALAMALAVSERHLRGVETAKAHLGFLEGWGYDVGEVEREAYLPTPKQAASA